MTMVENAPLVTVGIPTYNRVQGLERTLDCMLHQTYKNLEIIVSDNCSTDPAVRNLLEKFTLKDNRVRYYVQEKNLSIIPNFSYLLDNANGEYFMWAADDDFWDRDFIETCIKAMELNKAVVLCMTDLKFVAPDGTKSNSNLNRSFMQKGLLSRCFHFVKSTAENKFFFCGVYRTSAIKNIPFNNNWGGDHLFIYEALTKGKFLFISNGCSFYYFRGGSSRGTETIRRAFNIKNRFYFFDAYILRYTTYQFRFRHLTFFQKAGLFFANWAGLFLNEDFILYYIFIKKPIKALFSKFKAKKYEPVG